MCVECLPDQEHKTWNKCPSVTVSSFTAQVAQCIDKLTHLYMAIVSTSKLSRNV
jgi:hypothetical protein